MWNLLKLRMYAEYLPLTNSFKDLNKLGKHGKFLDDHYKTHFDITSGGQIIKYPWIPPIFEIFFTSVAISNRLSPNPVSSKILSNQLKAQHLTYWFGRVIDSPTALIITIFPGIWTDIFFHPNLIRGAAAWSNSLMLSMYLQKISVIGIRIDKIQPYIITPWSGYLYQSPDGGTGIAQIVGSIITNFLMSIDLMSAIVYQGDTSILDPFKNSYIAAINNILTPQLFEFSNSIPSIYGTDFRGIDMRNGKNMSKANEIVLGALNNSYGKILNGFGIEDIPSFKIPRDASKEPQSVILTMGGVSTYTDRSIYADSLHKDSFEIVDFFQIWRSITPNGSYSKYILFKNDLDLSKTDEEDYKIFMRVLSRCIVKANYALSLGKNVLYNYENLLPEERTLFISGISSAGVRFNKFVKLFDIEEEFRRASQVYPSSDEYDKELYKMYIKKLDVQHNPIEASPSFVSTENSRYRVSTGSAIVEGFKVIK